MPALVTAACMLTALSVARPLGPAERPGETAVSMDVIVALDVSDSMAVKDSDGERLDAAKAFIKKLVAAAPANRYGLVLFSGEAMVTCPPTLDHDAFLTFVDDADYSRSTISGTAIGEGILTALTRFKPGELPRAVLVVSDGENTYGADPVKAAGSAREKGLKVYAAGVGTVGGGEIPYGVDFFGKQVFKKDKEGRTVVSRLDEGALREIAGAGGGKYVAASDKGSVRELARELTAKSAKKAENPYKNAEEYGPWLALLAFPLVVTVIML
jgi:Ca-activated chloride channel family protein